MLEVNSWFFVQLANFLLLLFLLNIIIFKPLLRLFKEREEGTKGALEHVKALDQEKDEVLSQIDAKLADARGEAKTIFDGLSREGLDNQKDNLEAAQKESVEINKRAKEELGIAVDKARTALKSDIESFSKQIVEKLVGA